MQTSTKRVSITKETPRITKLLPGNLGLQFLHKNIDLKIPPRASIATCQYNDGNRHKNVGIKYRTVEYPVSIIDYNMIIFTSMLGMQPCRHFTTAAQMNGQEIKNKAQIPKDFKSNSLLKLQLVGKMKYSFKFAANPSMITYVMLNHRNPQSSGFPPSIVKKSLLKKSSVLKTFLRKTDDVISNLSLFYLTSLIQILRQKTTANP